MKALLGNRWAHLAAAWVLFVGFVGPFLISSPSDEGVGVGVALGLALVVLTTRDIASINFKPKESK